MSSIKKASQLIENKVMLISQLTKVIEKWMQGRFVKLENVKSKENQANSPSKITSHQSKKNDTYKFSLKKILPLPQGLMVKLALYFCVVQFPFLLSDLSQSTRVQLSLALKKIYNQKFYHGNWKKRQIFEFTCVYLSKEIASFVELQFPSIEINQRLQSLIFIIINKLFIGIQLGVESYSLISKKYQKSKLILPSNEKENVEKENVERAPSSKKKNTLIYSNKGNSTSSFGKLSRSGKRSDTLKRTFYSNKRKFSIINQEQAPKRAFNMFKSQLKESLFVKPLPQISPKKEEIVQFSLRKNSEHANDKCENISLTKTRILSNQVSPSFQIYSNHSSSQFFKMKLMERKKHFKNSKKLKSKNLFNQTQNKKLQSVSLYNRSTPFNYQQRKSTHVPKRKFLRDQSKGWISQVKRLKKKPMGHLLFSQDTAYRNRLNQARSDSIDNLSKADNDTIQRILQKPTQKAKQQSLNKQTVTTSRRGSLKRNAMMMDRLEMLKQFSCLQKQQLHNEKLEKEQNELDAVIVTLEQQTKQQKKKYGFKHTQLDKLRLQKQNFLQMCQDRQQRIKSTIFISLSNKQLLK